MSKLQEDIAALAILAEECVRSARAIEDLATNDMGDDWIRGRKRRLLTVASYVFLRIGVTREELLAVFDNTQWFRDNIVERDGDKGEATQKVG